MTDGAAFDHSDDDVDEIDGNRADHLDGGADDEIDPVNRREGAISEAVLEYLAKAIVDDAEAVVIEKDAGGRSVSLALHVAPSDMGRIIGRRGRVVQAVRTVVRAAAAREGIEARVEVVD